MWLKFFIFITFSTIVLARNPHFRHAPVRKASQDQLKVENPIEEIIRILEGDEKKDFIKLAKANRDLKKSEAQDKVDDFVSKLSDEQKGKIKKIKARIEKQQEDMDKKVKDLSKKAQDLYEKINKLIKDDLITKEEEEDKISDLLKKADKDVLAEFRKKKIQLPGAPQSTRDDDKDDNKKPRRGPGGYMGSIYYKLNRKQKMEVNRIFMQRNRVIKKVIRQKINTFVGKLSDELQKKFNGTREEHKKKLAKDKKTVTGMSSDAQKLYQDVMKVEKDGSITFPQTEVRIRKIVKKADKKVLDEFQEKNVSLPTIPSKSKNDDKKSSSEDDKKSSSEDDKKSSSEDDKKSSKEDDPKSKEDSNENDSKEDPQKIVKTKAKTKSNLKPKSKASSKSKRSSHSKKQH